MVLGRIKGYSSPARLLALLLFIATIAIPASAGYSLELSESKPPILFGIFWISDANSYLSLQPYKISSNEDLTAVGGTSILEREDESVSSRFIALFPNDSFTKLIFIDLNNIRAEETLSDLTVLKVRPSGGGGGIGDIALPPETQVWILMKSNLGKIYRPSIDLVSLDKDGKLRCYEGFFMEPLSGNYVSYSVLSPQLVHDGSRAYVIAPMFTDGENYAEDPLILAKFSSECELEEYKSFRIATSPSSSILISEAIYDSGYIYAAGILNSGAGGQGGAENLNILLLKISSQNLNIVSSKVFSIPWTSQLSFAGVGMDVSNGSIAISAYVNSNEDSGVVTLSVNQSTLEPIWATLTSFPDQDDVAGSIASAKIVDGTVFAIGYLYEGLSNNPDYTKEFIFSASVDTGEALATYSRGIEGSLITRDATVDTNNRLLVLSQWSPGVLHSGYNKIETITNTIEEIVVIDVPSSYVDQPLTSSEYRTGGVWVKEYSENIDTGYTKLKDASALVTFLEVSKTLAPEADTTTTPTNTETTQSQQNTNEKEDDNNEVLTTTTSVETSIDDYKYQVAIAALIGIIIILLGILLLRRR